MSILPRSLLALATSVLLSAGCTPAPGDPLYVTGRLLGSDGAPIADAGVRLERSVTVLEDGGAIRRQPATTQAVAQTTGDGWFQFELHQRDSQAQDLRLFIVRTPSDGASIGPGYAFAPQELEFPPTVSWQVTPTVTAVDGGVRIEVNPAPAAPIPDTSNRGLGDGGALTYELTVEHGDQVLWEQLSDAPRWEIPAAALEDLDGVHATVRTFQDALTDRRAPLDPVELGAVLQGQYTLFFEAMVASSLSGHQPVVSKGAPCSGLLPDDGPCVLTDGDVTPVSAGVAPGHDSVEFLLPRAVTPRLALFRGAYSFPSSAMCVLEGSSDGGATWTLLADVSPWAELPMEFVRFGPALEIPPRAIGRFFAVPLEPSGPVDRVRLRFGPEIQWPMMALGELSLFE